MNTALLEGAPKDPPPPRRSRRGAVSDTNEDCKPSATGNRANNTVASEDLKTVSGQDDCSVHFSEIYPSGEDQDRQHDERETKQRKRVVRNVGGWISPDFSRIVDRRWLDNDVPNSPFDLRTYVPQVGELVLYFITGHKEYLKAYPDIIGKKTRSKMRIPLWERAWKHREEGGDKTVSPWWTNQWLDGVETDGYGDYPIVCRVERTHAEFPSDPWSKVVKQGDETTSSTQQIFFKKPRNGGKQSRKQHLRLALDLRPLTQVVANGNSGEKLSVPPLFSVATSPSKSTEPFIVPFCWAYYRSLSLRLKQNVIATNVGSDSKMRVDDIACPPNLGVLVDKDREQLFGQLTTWLESISSKDNILQEKAGPHFPLSVVKFLIHCWREGGDCKDKGGASMSSSAPPDFSLIGVLQKTLPLWNSASVLQDVYDRKHIMTNPWNLVIPTKLLESANPWTVGHFKFCLDDSLRSKLLCFVDGILADESASVDLFRDPVSEEVAPSYYCAVPIGFSLSRISKRLTTDKPDGECFYSTTRQFVADVAAILDCALLYNSPESEVVSLAGVLTTKIKDAASMLIREHYRDAKEAEMLDHERRRAIHQRFSLQVGSAQAMTFKPFLSKPFRGDIHCWWTESTTQQKHSFQAGDSVQYNAAKHDQFVAGHGPSLEARQSEVHFDGKNNNEWHDAEVVWTKTDFPKSLTRHTDKQCDTFEILSTLQCLGLLFRDHAKIVTVYWRPCSFQEVPGLCKSCNSTCGESFLRLKSSDQAVTSFQDIYRCMHLIKRRCSNGLRPYEEDTSLTKASIKLGYLPQHIQAGRKLPPTFGEIFDDKTNPDSALKRQKAKKQVTKNQLEVSRLLELGFIPPWITFSSKIDEESLSKYKQHFASPSMSLELVCLRLQSGFYRYRQAIENDIVEAYCTNVFMLLFDSWNRRKDSLPMKRMARQLFTNKNWDRLKATIDDQLNHEEVSWLQRLVCVRELHCVSLSVVSDLTHAIRMLGLYSTPQAGAPSVAQVIDPDEQRADAYQKLTNLVQAVGRDECNNHFSLPSTDGEPPLTKFKIMIGGNEVEPELSVGSEPVPAKAIIRNRELTVNVALEGRPVSFPEFLEDVSDISEFSQWNYSTAPCVYFHSEDYENNDYLARLAFKRPGRTGACARCRAYRRSMMVCRVMRRHANPDYDWATELTGGEEYLNKLVHSLKDDSSIVIDTPSLSLEGKDVVPKIDEEKLEAVNPRKMLDDAKALLAVAEKLVLEAQTFSETPDRLSSDFIEEAFPIDDGDGHYLYCVICGLAGDLLCCDGCSTVVHTDCIGLTVPPPGDWFCEKCVIAKKGGQCDSSPSTTEVPASATAVTYGPFERATFDETELTVVTKKLHELRLKRPTQKVREVQPERAHVPPQDSDDESVESLAVEKTIDVEIDETSDVKVMKTSTSKKSKVQSKPLSIGTSPTRSSRSRRKTNEGQESRRAVSRSDKNNPMTSENDQLQPVRKKRQRYDGHAEEHPIDDSAVENDRTRPVRSKRQKQNDNNVPNSQVQAIGTRSRRRK